MNPENKEQNTQFFLGKISLPIYPGAVKQAVTLSSQIASALSFSKDNMLKLELAIEEAIDNSVSHFSGTPEESDQIHLEYTVDDGYFLMSIKEKGIPFYPEKMEQYDSSSLEMMELPGLGNFLINSLMDKVEFLINGRHGKELRLFKKLEHGSIPQELADQKFRNRTRKRTNVHHPIIRIAEISDLAEITRLAWRCYGYTQENVLYDLDLLTQKIKDKEIISFIAINPEDQALIGHMALKFIYPGSDVAEVALVFKDPAYRTPKLMVQMCQTIEKLVDSHGLKGVFTASVTTHIRSQMLSATMEVFACSLLLGIVAEGLQTKNFKTLHQQKGSVVNEYIAFDKSVHKVYPPLRHFKIIEKTYEWLKIPRPFGESSPPETTTVSDFDLMPLPKELHSGFIIVNTIGHDFKDCLNETFSTYRRNGWTSVYIFISLGDPACSTAVDECEKLGFFYAGIMPHVHNGSDRIILQHLDLTIIDWDQIRVYSKEGKQLRDYIKECSES